MLSKILLRNTTQAPLVLVSNQNNTCKASLNDPKALNSLSIQMIDALLFHLENWNNSPETRAVIFSGSGNKSFCAGGNIRALYAAKIEGKHEIFTEFFSKEYYLDYWLSKMRPVQISIYNGIVMGGGAGISFHSPIKIATETSVFAMPETTIGLYPDVGGSYFLPRLPGNIGLYLGITAGRLTGKELVQAGVATHFVKSENIEELTNKLIKSITLDTSIQEIGGIVDKFSTEVSGPLEENEKINKYFGKAESVEDIFSRLSDGSEWGSKKLKSMEKLCPLSMKIAYEQNKRGLNLTLKQALEMEYRISLNFMKGHNFFEGFRALLLDKDKNPQWEQKDLSDVPESLVLSYFEPPSKSFKELNLDEKP